MHPTLTRIIFLLFTLPALGQTGSAVAVPILRGAELPIYPPIAMAARITGKAVVRVTVKDGLVAQADVQSNPALPPGHQFLDSPTVANLKTWRFDARVAAIFRVTYTYEIAGDPTDDPTNARVEMLPSLDVKITARPVKPTVNS